MKKIEANPSFQILRLLKTRGIGITKVREILSYANEKKSTLEDVLADSEVLKNLLSPTQHSAFLGNKNDALEEYYKLEDNDISLFSLFDKDYPERLRFVLGGYAPPLLSVIGNRDLFSKASVGFCGSRKASDKGLVTARDCSEQLAREGINVVSGYAAGVDMITHLAALESGGTTTVVLAEGILHFKIKQDLREIWDLNRVVVVSEFLPSIPWNVGNAMQRNETICALSNAMVLIEAMATGGSIEAGRKCLELELPLFAPVYEGMPKTATGNRMLLKQGARQLLKSRKTDRANIKEILKVVKEDGMRGKKPSPPKSSLQKTEKQISIFRDSGQRS